MEAQNLWMRGDQTRLHPFHAACIYKTGVVCLDQGKVEAAMCVISSTQSNLDPQTKKFLLLPSKHLRDSLKITKFHANVMPVEHARGLLKLSEALLQDSYNSSGEVTDLRDEVEVYLLRRDPQAVEFTKEADFDLWVPIFWR